MTKIIIKIIREIIIVKSEIMIKQLIQNYNSKPNTIANVRSVYSNILEPSLQILQQRFLNCELTS